MRLQLFRRPPSPADIMDRQQAITQGWEMGRAITGDLFRARAEVLKISRLNETD